MADLGAIAKLRNPHFVRRLDGARENVLEHTNFTQLVKRIEFTSGYAMTSGAVKSSTVGNSSAPSLYMDRISEFSIRWAVKGGVANTFSVYAKQAVAGTLRPRVTAKANAAIGVAADVSATLASGTGWMQIGPVSVTPSSDGVLIVLLENRSDASDADCYWDDITVTPDLTTGKFGYWQGNSPVFNFGRDGSTPSSGETSYTYVV
ncbi:MAG: hypothetical protein ACOYB3_00015 [Azonexus sp.]